MMMCTNLLAHSLECLPYAYRKQADDTKHRVGGHGDVCQQLQLDVPDEPSSTEFRCQNV
jgi:hypothetical protein